MIFDPTDVEEIFEKIFHLYHLYVYKIVLTRNSIPIFAVQLLYTTLNVTLYTTNNEYLSHDVTNIKKNSLKAIVLATWRPVVAYYFPDRRKKKKKEEKITMEKRGSQ